MIGADRARFGWTDPRRLALAIVLVLAVTALAGCGLLGSGASEADVPTGEEAASSFASIESLSGTVEVTESGPNETTTVVQRLQVRPQVNHVRIETLEPESRAGNLRVSNGSVVWEYNATENRALRQAYSGPSRQRVFDERLRYIFDSLSGEGTDDAPGSDLDVSPLPVVPSGGSGPTVSLANASFAYEGIETVGDHRTHVVRIEANGTRTRLRNQTMWLHEETFYPLKVRSVVMEPDGRTVYDQVARNVTFDASIPPERFRFEPPADATVRHTSVDLQMYSDLAALRANVSMAVPSAQVGPNFDLVQGSHLTQLYNGTTYDLVELVYSSGVAQLYVVKQRPPQELDNVTEGEDVENVTVGSQTGRYVPEGPDVYWICDGSLYRVGGGLSRARLLEVAESVACE